MSIAQTILSQIKTIDPRATWAWGAKELVNMGDGLKFKTSGMVKWKGQVYIKYNEGSDLYDIEFFRIRGANVKYDKQVSDVFAEDLVNIIDSVVG
jgi:hypothetical protein